MTHLEKMDAALSAFQDWVARLPGPYLTHDEVIELLELFERWHMAATEWLTSIA